jgi:hypothetical protein
MLEYALNWNFWFKNPYWCIDIIKDYFLIKFRWHEGCTSQVVIGVKGYGYLSAIPTIFQLYPNPRRISERLV